MEKYLATKETGCGLVIVGRPKKEEGVSLEECLEYLRNRWNLQQEHKTHQTEREISIVGIGMGTSGKTAAKGYYYFAAPIDIDQVAYIQWGDLQIPVN